jgi:hypothetical protein
MPSPRRVKKSVRKSPLKNVRKSARKTLKSVRKTRKSTKRSYRLGVKVSEGGKTFDAREWQERALSQFLGTEEHNAEFTSAPMDPNYKVKIGNYTVFFNRDANGLSYHPAKTIEKIITEEVPDTSRKVRIYRDMSIPSSR